MHWQFLTFWMYFYLTILLLLLHELLTRTANWTKPYVVVVAAWTANMSANWTKPYVVVVAAWTANTYCWTYCCFNHKEYHLVRRNSCRCLSCSLKCVGIQKIYILGPGHDCKLPRRLDRQRFGSILCNFGTICAIFALPSRQINVCSWFPLD